jgi:peptide/nickel transport system substrate-binding protein
MNERELRATIAAVRAGVLTRRQFIDRLVGLGLTAPMAAGLLTHAGLASAQPAPAYKPTKRGGGGLLRLLFWQGPTLLNPHFASGSKDQEGSRPFCEPLIRFDADGEPQAVLAAEVPSRANGGLAADGKSVLWKLRPGVQWHDGKPFTADDVVFNWQYATDPAAAAWTAGQYDNVKAVEKVDALSVRTVFEKPMPNWAQHGNVQLLPKHLFDAYRGAKAREAPNNLKPVGTGPYRFVEFKPGDLVRGELNPNYHEPNRPHFDAFELKGGGDAISAARTVLQTGEYDFAWNLLVEDEVLKRMESGGKGRVVFTPGGDTEYIRLAVADPWVETDGERAHPKSRHPILRDKAVRQALLQLTDRRAIQQFVYGRGGTATANVLNNPARFNSPNGSLEASLDKANALLDSAGWKRGADGIREKDGRKLRFVYQSSINAVRQKVQLIVKQSCGKAGIDIELKSVVSSVFFASDVGNPDTMNKFWADIQMYAFTRTPDPGRFMQQFVSWESSSKANKWLGMNNGRWTNDDYDKAFRAAEVELDPVKRAALFIRMNDLVCSDVHVIPVVYRPKVDAVARNLVAPLSGWDVELSMLADWYREA